MQEGCLHFQLPFFKCDTELHDDTSKYLESGSVRFKSGSTIYYLSDRGEII